MTLFKDRFRIESARLSGYDYRTAGWYFVTICTQNKICAFGHVQRYEVQRSSVGQIVMKCWREIPNHYCGLELDAFVVMPNHLHGIVILQGLPAGPLLSNVIGSFKSAASRECRKEGLDTFRWQSRFYDRIIHNEDSIGAVRLYIQMNPVNWAEDEFFMAA